MLELLALAVGGVGAFALGSAVHAVFEALTGEDHENVS